MRKRTLVLLSLWILLIAVLIPSFNVKAAEDVSYRVVLEDDADLLSDAEEALLRQKMTPIAEYANVAFHSVSQHSYSSTKAYAEAYYVQTFGGGVSGTIFLIDMKLRMIYIVSDGAAYRTVTDSRANTITDNIYTYASNKDYYGCAASAFDQIHTILEGGKIAEPMKYVSNAMLAAAASLLFMFLIVQSVTNPKGATKQELLASSVAAFRGQDPVSTHTGQTRRYDPPSSSSSGGSHGGGGGGGGGGFSGGGGGHSF